MNTLEGKHILSCPDSYVCVDLETTGLNPCSDRIIEIGAVKVLNHVITAQFQSLINPGFRISSFISGLTGITNEMLTKAPPVSQVFPEFLSFIGDLPLVGHNIHCFDIKFLRMASLQLMQEPLSNNYFDTLYMARRLYPAERHNRLQDLIVRFGIADLEEHRALSDALQTVACYDFMRKAEF